MLQECNKFREHQARELLIELLENQLSKRQEALDEIKEEVGKADYALDEIRQISNIAASDGGMRM